MSTLFDLTHKFYLYIAWRKIKTPTRTHPSHCLLGAAWIIMFVNPALVCTWVCDIWTVHVMVCYLHKHQPPSGICAFAFLYFMEAKKCISVLVLLLHQQGWMQLGLFAILRYSWIRSRSGFQCQAPFHSSSSFLSLYWRLKRIKWNN